MPLKGPQNGPHSSMLNGMGPSPLPPSPVGRGPPSISTSVLPPSPVRRGGDQPTVTVVVARATAAVIESPVLTDDGSTDGYLVQQKEARGARVR